MAQEIHKIKKGDTFFSLSRTYGVSVNELTVANPSVQASALRIGQEINIPTKVTQPSPHPVPTPSSTANPNPTETVIRLIEATPTPTQHVPPPRTETLVVHVVAAGETLTRIALRYKITVALLQSENNLNTTNLRVGQRLKIPNSGAIQESTTTAPPLLQPTLTPTLKITPTVTTTPIPIIAPVLKPTSTPSPTSSPTPKQRYVFVTPVKKQIDQVSKSTRKWKYVVVHHSGTKSGSAKIFEYYHRRIRGMENGMAYHFVIGNGSDTGDGEIEVGNRWRQQLQGGHLKSDEQNDIAIGICLVGNYDKDRPNKKQIAALIELVTYLRQRQHPVELQFVVHRDINVRPTDCPGRLFPSQAMYKLFGKFK